MNVETLTPSTVSSAPAGEAGVLVFPDEQIRTLRLHAEGTYPEECCGALLGVEERTGVRAVEIVIPLHNAHPKGRRRRFSISPSEYRRAEREAETRGLVLLGFYHSHPDHPPIPSTTDRQFAVPGFSYPIVQVVARRALALRSWRLASLDGDYIEEAVAIDGALDISGVQSLQASS